MEETTRDFKGVWIPRTVWLDTRLNALEKVILTEIDSLDNGERGCWASNKHIAEFCQCSETKVSTAISKLIDLGYLYLQSFDGRSRELKSSLSNFERQNLINCEAAFKNLQESNTGNNPSNNSGSKRRKKESSDSFNQIINSYLAPDGKSARFEDHGKRRELLQEWLKVRKAKRAAMTDRAISMNIEKLDSLAAESQMSVPEYLEEVIRRGWAAFYPITTYASQKQTGYRRQEVVPHWLTDEGKSEMSKYMQALHREHGQSEEPPVCEGSAEELRKRLKEKYGAK